VNRRSAPAVLISTAPVRAARSASVSGRVPWASVSSARRCRRTRAGRSGTRRSRRQLAAIIREYPAADGRARPLRAPTASTPHDMPVSPRVPVPLRGSPLHKSPTLGVIQSCWDNCHLI
jgi:hypothetical protein